MDRNLTKLEIGEVSKEGHTLGATRMCIEVVVRKHMEMWGVRGKEGEGSSQEGGVREANKGVRVIGRW